MDNDEKVRENRARRVLSRRGYVLHKSRRRDVNAIDYGGYMISDENNCAVAGSYPIMFGYTLEDVEEWIAEV